MTEEQRSMIYGMDAFMKRLEFSFRNDKETLKKLRAICEQAYYDIVFNESSSPEDKQFNIFNIRTTEEEKQELSEKLFQFHDDYENNFSNYFNLEDDEALDEFLYCYRSFYELIDDLMDRDLHSEHN